MIEILLDFERSAGQLSPVILAIPALLMVLPGLLMWLAGMGIRRIFLGTAGAVSGASCGFFFSGGNLLVTVAVTAGATAMAVLLERVFIPLVSGVLAVVIVLAVLCRGQVTDGDSAANVRTSPASVENLPAGIVQSVQILGGYAAALADEVKTAYQSIPAKYWTIGAVVGAIFVLGGLIAPRFACAWTFSTLGTMLIFAGMILLLSYRGSAPISKISQRGLYYGGVFGAMIVLGTGEQLLLFRKAFRAKLHKQQPAGEEKQTEEGKAGWRGK